MANVFTSSNEVTNKPNRNTFNMGFTNNLTLKMGQITPCFVQDVISGDSVRINPSFGFNFMPMTFPVQTKIRANLHFFYVRNRALWRGWESFITKTDNEWDDKTPPYIRLTEENRDMFETGKIGDFLNVPTVLYSKGYESLETKFNVKASDSVVYATSFFNSTNSVSWWRMASATYVNGYEGALPYISSFLESLNSTRDNNGLYPLPWPVVEGGPASQDISLYLRRRLAPHSRFLSVNYNTLVYVLSNSSYLGRNNQLRQVLGDGSSYEDKHFMILVATKGSEKNPLKVVAAVQGEVYTGSLGNISFYNAERGQTTIDFNLEDVGEPLYVYVFTDAVVGSSISESDNFDDWRVSYVVDGRFGIDNKYRLLSDLPFANSTTSGGERISALPFRAVDACYNAFYRDIRNNPFIKDGKPLYNKWVWSNEGGADTRHYGLYRANWEQDAYTTAVQSPQQGSMPPLVGVTSTGKMTFQDEEGNTYTAQATIGEDGETITGISTHSSDMPVGTLRALVDTISSGISINDFRNVNAYQVWLERNMRKGLRYKDQIEAHFGTSPTYSELQMPEFIGGISRVVDMRAITQTSGDATGAPLGTLAGQASLMAETKEYITKYCDEHGFIIGFISFVPVPIYTQLLPKMLTRNELFDYYFPEFANIGFQPILNKELAILQCRDEEGKRPDDVFGYQRAWYDYLQRTDEAHGEFRDTMRNYIIHRTYNGVPELSAEFLTVSPDEANEVFAVQSDTDKIFGQLFFDFSMKRPIPKYGIPSLKVD